MIPVNEPWLGEEEQRLAGEALAAGWISKVIGEGGASVVSRVMGLILASVAATNVLEGIKLYYQP